MKLVFGNFKMNLVQNEIDDYLAYFKGEDCSNAFFAPPAIFLKDFVKSGLKTAAQDVGMDEKGAYTGDISAQELKSIGVNYAIVGHSERRMYYQDDKYVNKKLHMLLKNEINPILCIGENLEERQKGIYQDVLKREIDEAFKDISKSDLQSIIIAYEPIWAIGTGVIPTNDEIKETISYIKDYVNKCFDIKIKVLYGGSVNNHCINTLEEVIIIDGYLVGGCSIKKEDFKKLIDTVK